MLTKKQKPINSVLFKLLAKRDYARKELFSKLKTLEYSESDIESALNQAEKEGFINDQRFTENYIRRRSLRGYGPLRIRAELEEKGIDSEQAALCMPNEFFWQELAEKVRQKRFGETIPKDFADKAKQMRFLQYRGFSSDQMAVIN